MADLIQRRDGELDTHVITSTHQPDVVVIFCHGFGAPADDLVPVGAQLIQQFPKLLDRVEIIFPGAPLSLAEHGIPMGRAWWHLDLARLANPGNSRDIEAMRKDCPDGLPRSRELLTGLVHEALARHQLSASQLVIGGFSQGAMLATDVALHLPDPVGGLVVWSGALINELDWSSRRTQLAGMPVVQSHGTADPILPFQSGVWLQDLFKQGNARLNFLRFDGPHTIPGAAIAAAGSLLETFVRDDTPAG